MSMESKFCMNESCRATTSPEWKKGWALKSGGLATLCYNCGLAYENSVFCETFHLEDSGWRECKICGKRIHCGCIASKFMHEYLDFGGVGCLSCVICSESQLIRPVQTPSDDMFSGLGTLAAICVPQPTVIKNPMEGNRVGKGKLTQLSKSVEENQPNDPNLFLQSQSGMEENQPNIPNLFLQPQSGGPNPSSWLTKQEENMFLNGEVGTGFSHLSQHSGHPSILFKQDGNIPISGHKNMYESLATPSLSFSFSTPLGTPDSVLPLHEGAVVEGREKKKAPPFKQGQRTRHVLTKPSKSGLTIGAQANKGMVTQMQAARPPAEGRGRNQLLPRYWPKITDQELQQLSGDLNSTIVPLFEKVLSASDAGRIGRLVLPKACAEAYFPPIHQSDGLPIRIQDIKGKEWTFQFRFWPNNNSRMYVLEGITPCIQNMQLQAGDTVIFSRIDPGGKLVMGCRKATKSADMQEIQISTLPIGESLGDASVHSVNEDLSTDIFNWRKNEEHGSVANGDSIHQQTLNPGKKKSRNIGSKSKRLHMHSEDAIELRITWVEAQQLLRPPPSVKPTIVMIDNHEFEEYDEPPIIGKRTIFTARDSGEHEQWAQCDSCSKWRRVPVEILLPARWTCSDNIWDSNRCSCSAPDEMEMKELESCFRGSKDVTTKKQRFTEHKAAEKLEPSGLDALATAAVLGDDVEETGEASVGVTTRHPRHRRGCTCIVCIQPPSGKGKHKATCICNVCMTVKRRFKTLMLRKKKRQEFESENIEAPSVVEGTSEHAMLQNEMQMEVAESNKVEHLDLNCHPRREDMNPVLAEDTGSSMRTPLEMMNTRNNGVVDSLGPCLLSKAAGENEVPPSQ